MKHNTQDEHIKKIFKKAFSSLIQILFALNSENKRKKSMGICINWIIFCTMLITLANKKNNYAHFHNLTILKFQFSWGPKDLYQENGRAAELFYMDVRSGGNINKNYTGQINVSNGGGEG